MKIKIDLVNYLYVETNSVANENNKINTENETFFSELNRLPLFFYNPTLVTKHSLVIINWKEPEVLIWLKKKIDKLGTFFFLNRLKRRNRKRE